MIEKLSFDFYIGSSFLHGLSPFSNKFAIKFLQNSICPRGSVNGDIKIGSTEFSDLSSF